MIKLHPDQLALIDQHVADVKHLKATPRTTFCVLVLKNGFEIHGVSACLDLSKYDEEKGKRYSLYQAVTRLERYVKPVIDTSSSSALESQ